MVFNPDNPNEHAEYDPYDDAMTDDPARFFGHLELVNIFTRAMRRAAIPLKYSQGFHPKPKVAFRDALPVGMESRAETMIFSARAELDPRSLVGRLNAQLPPGLKVLDCRRATDQLNDLTGSLLEYAVYLTQGEFAANCLDAFNQAERFTFTRRRGKGKLKSIDLKTMIKAIEIRNPRELRLRLRLDNGAPPRPAIIMTHIFGLTPDQVAGARVVKFPDF